MKIEKAEVLAAMIIGVLFTIVFLIFGTLFGRIPTTWLPKANYTVFFSVWGVATTLILATISATKGAIGAIKKHHEKRMSAKRTRILKLPTGNHSPRRFNTNAL